MIKILKLLLATLIMWLLSSIIGGNWNPMEWHWVWRFIAILWYLAVCREVNKDYNLNSFLDRGEKVTQVRPRLPAV
jgi:hypothetical protein